MEKHAQLRSEVFLFFFFCFHGFYLPHPLSEAVNTFCWTRYIAVTVVLCWRFAGGFVLDVGRVVCEFMCDNIIILSHVLLSLRYSFLSLATNDPFY